MKLLFVHGWGFDSRVWDGIREHLNDFAHDCIDFGFTTDTFRHETLPDEPYIAIGHSLGVMWALKNNTSNMKGLISIGGFDCFHKHIPKAVIDGFRDRLQNDPQGHMQGFWAQGLDAPLCPIAHLNLDRLADAIDWLASWNAEQAAQEFTGPILAIALKNDKIVPAEMSKAVWEKYAQVRLVWHDTGSHFLPVTEPAWCAEQIKDFIDAHSA